MRLLLGADVHGSGRNDEERELSNSIFKEAYTLAVANQVDTVVWLGDLLHFKYGLELRLLLDWGKIIEKYTHRGIQTIMFPGNHDKPWDKEPDRVAIDMLKGTCYTEPTIVVTEAGVMLAYLPWFPPEEFKEHAKALAMKALGHTGLKFLFSHTSLAEGYVSPSNFQVETQIRMSDLLPESWDHVFLGDYHAHQKVGNRITYLGAPIPRTFGDHNNLGYWLLDIRDNGTWFFKQLSLTKRYPQFHKLTFGFFETPEEKGKYIPGDHYRITCPSIRVIELSKAYPGAVVKSIPGHYVIPKSVNPTINSTNSFTTFRSWLELKGLDPDVYYPIGEDALKRSLGNVR